MLFHNCIIMENIYTTTFDDKKTGTLSGFPVI